LGDFAEDVAGMQVPRGVAPVAALVEVEPFGFRLAMVIKVTALAPSSNGQRAAAAVSVVDVFEVLAHALQPGHVIVAPPVRSTWSARSHKTRGTCWRPVSTLATVLRLYPVTSASRAWPYPAARRQAASSAPKAPRACPVVAGSLTVSPSSSYQGCQHSVANPGRCRPTPVTVGLHGVTSCVEQTRSRR
jgi:hypothetical protein